MKIRILAFLGIWMSFAVQAQMDKKQLDEQAIKAMCGCYEITFKYTETFAPNEAYEKKPDYTAHALEWVKLIDDTDGNLSLQHLLVINDSTIIKHWRQDWIYEPQNLFTYKMDNIWTFNKADEASVDGQWAQKVYQIDDSPRYSGSATWIHTDGKAYWENASFTPLPRREYSKRDDYNVMKRGNRQEITDYGWVHEQDNDKIIRDQNLQDVLLAQEKGFNVYKKVDDSQCIAAEKWWEENQKLWKKIRDVWQEVYNREGDLQLKKMVDGKPLFRHFKNLNNKSSKKEIREIIQKFIVS